MALATVGLASACSAVASPVAINFSTVAISTSVTLGPALARAGITITPATSIAGQAVFESTTADTNAAPSIGLYNSAVDKLNINVSSWFSQALTGIGNNGDITVSNNTGTGNNVVDRIAVSVTGIGSQSNGRFAYSFIDPGLLPGAADDVIWQLDQFLLTLTQNPPGAGLPTHLTSDALPTEGWSSNAWSVHNIQLRFNPVGITGGNGTASGIIEFIEVAEVPEPASLSLVGLALLGLVGLKHDRRMSSRRIQ